MPGHEIPLRHAGKVAERVKRKGSGKVESRNISQSEYSDLNIDHLLKSPVF
jgi:hypothetical protein